MGIFSKRKPDKQPATTSPVNVTDVDVQKLSDLLDSFNQSVGMDGPVRVAVHEIARAGGYVSLEETMRRGGDVDEPWRWINAVAHRAAARGDDLLVGRIFVFLTFWTDVISPQMGLADFSDIGMGGAPERVQADTAALALTALANMPSDTVLMENRTGAMGAATMTRVAADRICRLNGKGIPVAGTALEAAHRILDQ